MHVLSIPPVARGRLLRYNDFPARWHHGPDDRQDDFRRLRTAAEPRAGSARLDPHPARIQEFRLHRAERRLLLQEPAGRLRRYAGRFRRRGQVPAGDLAASDGQAGAVSRRRPALRAEGGRDRGHRPLGARLPAAEKAALLRVSAHHPPFAAAHQHVHGRFPRAQPGRLRPAQVLPRERLRLRAHADHHRQRLRGRRPDVPRHHPRSRPSAPGQSGRSGFQPGLLRPRDQPDRVGAAECRGLLPGLRPRLHLRSHLPRRELQHPAPRLRILDDRARDRLRRPGRQHAPGRGHAENRDRLRAGAGAAGDGVLQPLHRHRAAGAAAAGAGRELRARHLHPGQSSCCRRRT